MMRRTPFTFLIHLALAIIVAGAFVTHFLGIQGSVTLHDGVTVDRFERTSGPGNGRFPFNVCLDSASVIYYPDTMTPMDFKSTLSIDGRQVSVAMNHVAVVDGWRFYQSGMGAETSTLSVSHDPWGVGITYTGYVLLVIGMIGFFFQKKTIWHSLLTALRKGMPVLAILLFASAASATDTELPTMQKPLARNFGKTYVYWNNRICPMQTMAIDVTAKLYGSRSYRGMTPEQVLAGWLFYYDSWLRDYNETHSRATTARKEKKESERQALIQWIGTGRAFRIFPYRTASGHMEWLSLTERKPSQMPLDQWIFINRAVSDVNNLLLQGRNRAANQALTSLVNGQKRYAGIDVLPSDARFKAELFYNNYIRIVPGAVIMLLAGLTGLLLGLSHSLSVKLRKCLQGMVIASAVIASIWLMTILSLRGWIGAHWPLSNGCETMLFMAFGAAFGACISRGPLFRGALLLVAAMAAFVAAMAATTPQIASLTPVLDSPLLTVHVMIVMCSYVLFLLMAILAAVALAKGGETARSMARINAIILMPAVFLLTAGIFIGAVWANQSWGRYWGWDPKETCALITMLIYAVPIHRICLYGSPKKADGQDCRKAIFADPKVLNIYLLCAVASVIFTYFGANFLIPGLHSYA